MSPLVGVDDSTGTERLLIAVVMNNVIKNYSEQDSLEKRRGHRLDVNRRRKQQTDRAQAHTFTYMWIILLNITERSTRIQIKQQITSGKKII